MTEEQAVAIANAFVEEQAVPDPRLQGQRYRYSLVGAHFGGDNTWDVVYNIVFPDSPRSVWDGPVVVIVDPITQKAFFFR